MSFGLASSALVTQEVLQYDDRQRDDEGHATRREREDPGASSRAAEGDHAPCSVVIRVASRKANQ